MIAPNASPRVLLHVFATFRVGGPQVRFAHLANHLGTAYRHLIVAMDGRYDCSARFGRNVDFELVRLAPGRRGTLSTAWSSRRMLGRIRPSLLLTYNWGAIEWALGNWLPVCPHIHFESGFGPEERDAQLRRRVLFRRVALARTARVVLPSQTLYDIASREWRLSGRKLQYVPNGIQTGRFETGPDWHLLRSFGVDPARPLVGTVAVLRPEKNLTRLLRAFAVVRQETGAQLLIVGEGAERDRLERTADELGVGGDVIFAGGLERPELVLGAMDVFALSSDTEQMPCSILEAMAAGRPVVSTNVGDVRAMVGATNRRFIVGRDERELAEALRTLLCDAGLRHETGRENRRRAVQEFSYDKYVRTYEELFRMG